MSQQINNNFLTEWHCSLYQRSCGVAAVFFIVIPDFITHIQILHMTRWWAHKEPCKDNTIHKNVYKIMIMQIIEINSSLKQAHSYKYFISVWLFSEWMYFLLFCHDV